MTELNESNKKIYLDLCEKVWNFDETSMAYVNYRLSDEWEPVPEIKRLIDITGGKYEDQRIRIDIDMNEPTIKNIFEKSDESYKLFISSFSHCLMYLQNELGCEISYSDFINNKVVYKKNLTKIKKVLELAYKENPGLLIQDSFGEFSDPAKFIVERYERIGACKKSSKNIQLVISLNPMDWLLASTSDPKLSSCLNLANPNGGYGYCLGLPFLCGDRNRMMFYVSDGTTKEFMGMKIDKFQTRTWCILDKKDLFSLIKWYPNDTMGVEPVKIITKCGNITDRNQFSEGKYPIDVLSTKKGMVVSIYNDMGQWIERDGKLIHFGNSKCGQQIFSKNLVPTNLHGINRHSFHIDSSFRNAPILYNSTSYNIPYWRKNGFSVDMMVSTAKCNCCGSTGKGGFSLSGRMSSSFYCYDCFKEKTATCSICSTIKPIGEHKMTNITSKKGKEYLVCENCKDYIKDYTCEYCNDIKTSDERYELRNTNENKKICNNCVNELGFKTCNSCNNLFKNNLVIFNELEKTSSFKCLSCGNKHEIYSSSKYGKFWKVIKRKPGVNPVE